MQKNTASKGYVFDQIGANEEDLCYEQVERKYGTEEADRRFGRVEPRFVGPNKIVNTTPHDVNLYDDKGVLHETFKKSANPLRLKEIDQVVGNLGQAPIKKKVFTLDESLPTYDIGIFYIVSRVLAEALKAKGRTEDILIPSDTIRDDEGNIKGCMSFAKL